MTNPVVYVHMLCGLVSSYPMEAVARLADGVDQVVQATPSWSSFHTTSVSPSGSAFRHDARPGAVIAAPRNVLVVEVVGDGEAGGEQRVAFQIEPLGPASCLDTRRRTPGPTKRSAAPAETSLAAGVPLVRFRGSPCSRPTRDDGACGVRGAVDRSSGNFERGCRRRRPPFTILVAIVLASASGCLIGVLVWMWLVRLGLG